MAQYTEDEIIGMIRKWAVQQGLADKVWAEMELPREKHQVHTRCARDLSDAIRSHFGRHATDQHFLIDGVLYKASGAGVDVIEFVEAE